MEEPFWTKGRREFLGKRLGEFIMISVAAGYASDFFVKFPFLIKFTIWLSIITAIIIGILITPEKGEE